jgi:tetratricopeptide (TPR) repeat protein
MGPEGRDDAGYPKRVVDQAALRSLLMNREFKRLSEVIEAFQSEFESNPRYEERMYDAYDVLGYAHPQERELIDAWLAATPGSFAPYLASAFFWENAGFLWRGSRFIRETSDLERGSMAEAFARARRDANKALSLRPRLIVARNVLIRIEVADGSRELATQIMEEGLRQCPSCYFIRAKWMWALMPQWGGSYQEMEDFATQRADPKNPRHLALRGMVLIRRSAEAADHGDRAKTRALLDQACAFGHNPAAFAFRADANGVKGARALAAYLADVDRALAMHPGLSDVLLRRAWALSLMHRWEEAGRDLLEALRRDPTLSMGSMHTDFVRALDTLGTKKQRAGKTAVAIRLYELALALAPHQNDVAQHLQAARAAPPSTPSAEDAAPATGDASPDLVVTVVDEAGHPVPGARVAVSPGLGDWFQLERTVESLASAKQADGSGRLQIPLGVGPYAVVAALPRAPWRGTAISVTVTSSGAELKIAIRGSEAVTGHIADDASHPIAGVEVLALPDVQRLGPEPRSFGAARSGSDGSFTLRGLDSGKYRYRADGEAYGSTMGWIMPLGSADREGRLVLRVVRKVILRGRVLVKREGHSPAAPEAFRVNALGTEHRFSAEAKGRFSIALTTASKSLLASFSVEGRPEVVRELDVRPEGIDSGDVLIGPGRLLRGSVVDPDGSPISDAYIGLQLGNPLARSATDGTFEATIPNGPVTLRVRHNDWQPALAKVQENQTEVEIALSAGARLKVLMVDGAGSPLEGAVIRLFSPNAMKMCRTDTTGRCEIGGLDPGQLTVTSDRPPSADPTSAAPAALRVPIQGAADQGVVIRWANERAKLKVNILDKNGRKSPTTAWVFPRGPAFRAALETDGHPKMAFHAVFSEQLLENLPPDRYTVIALSPTDPSACALAAVALRGGEEHALTLHLGDGSCK